jgi:hypothetical protein
MIIKHIKHKINDPQDLKDLRHHLDETTSRIEGVEVNDIYFSKNREEFILIMKCNSEESYLNWRKICPPPQGAKDWYEVFITKEEHFAGYCNLQ